MSTPNPWPPTPDAPLLESIIDEIGRLRRRVEQLEIENRTHARMDTRLGVVEQWIAREDEWRAEQLERGGELMTTSPPDPEINNDRLYWVFAKGETLACKGPFRDEKRARKLAGYIDADVVLGVDVTYLGMPITEGDTP